MTELSLTTEQVDALSDVFCDAFLASFAGTFRRAFRVGVHAAFLGDSGDSASESSDDGAVAEHAATNHAGEDGGEACDDTQDAGPQPACQDAP